MDLADLHPQSREQLVDELRRFSRQLVRELGFMRATLAGSELAPSAVHAILEIGAAPGLQARDLAERLRLDKSNTSRQLSKLEALGLLTREAVSGDGRAYGLYLTQAGQALRRKIDQFGTEQVSHALRRMQPADQRALVRSLSLYADALARDNDGKSPVPPEPAGGPLLQGYRPGCIGDVAALHARFYAQAAGFGVYFEQKVATELAAFAQGLPAPGKALWLYVEQERALASLAIDGDPAAGPAHLRWFIVDGALRGQGIGRRLLEQATAFADAQGYAETYLWTFKGLDAARHLYEAAGFRLAEQAEGRQWGAVVTEQRFVRARPAAAARAAPAVAA